MLGKFCRIFAWIWENLEKLESLEKCKNDDIVGVIGALG